MHIGVHQSVQAFLHLIELLGPLTYTLISNAECAYASGFKSGWRHRMSFIEDGCLWEEWGPCSEFALYTLAFALHLRKNYWKNSVRARLISAEHDSCNQFAQHLAVTSTCLLSPAALGFHVRQRVAEIEVPHFS